MEQNRKVELHLVEFPSGPVVLYMRSLHSVLGVEAVRSQTWLVNELTCDGSTAPVAPSFRGGVAGGHQCVNS